ncbi:hypothetical protein MFUM_1020029 [Methylacidiphilum fumariolicum SolV]|uniref:Uncharacterized protein n=2 Tax=Candidatus Methylacidiphilum fumarolicum TaxID=591154 RepID=I0JVN7_METFB|nr:conserved protein of unknown function [Candidatus Methylacidiphilum fumarolicum]CCG91306.1 hypothetical protein MFUM_1020029 [Methylacidiphilum fumariolicum SolV]
MIIFSQRRDARFVTAHVEDWLKVLSRKDPASQDVEKNNPERKSHSTEDQATAAKEAGKNGARDAQESRNVELEDDGEAGNLDWINQDQRDHEEIWSRSSTHLTGPEDHQVMEEGQVKPENKNRTYGCDPLPREKAKQKARTDRNAR